MHTEITATSAKAPLVDRRWVRLISYRAGYDSDKRCAAPAEGNRSLGSGDCVSRFLKKYILAEHRVVVQRQRIQCVHVDKVNEQADKIDDR